MKSQRRVLIAGVSGVVGFAAARAFAAAGWEVVGLSRRRPERLPADIEHLAVDLSDAGAVGRILGDVEPISHLVYAALYEKPGLVSGWLEQDQMERNRVMLDNLFSTVSDWDGFEHVSLLQGTKAYGAHIEPMAVPGRERNPRHAHENFYWLQEDYLRDTQLQDHEGGRPWQLTIIRPQVIYGEAQGGNMNALPAIGVYAALLKARGEPLHFPGGVPSVSEAVDADLVARMLVWAAESPVAHGETFNVTNGDVYTMRNVWPVVAEAFGMEVGEDRPRSLAAEMPAREGEWAEVVERFDLIAPSSLEQFVGQSFIYADLILGYGQTRQRSPSLVSTIKARQAGFGDCVDTEDMFRRLIGVMQEARLLPPR